VAIEINCEVQGVEEFKQAMQRFDSAMQLGVHEQLANWAAETENLARQLVPVRTGYLRSTIYSKTSEWIAEIGAEATYASFIEFRTRPYLGPAIQEQLPKLEQIIANAIDAAKSEARL